MCEIGLVPVPLGRVQLFFFRLKKRFFRFFGAKILLTSSLFVHEDRPQCGLLVCEIRLVPDFIGRAQLIFFR